MTTAEATAYTAFIVHPIIRRATVLSLVSGHSFICADCNQIANTENGCFPCTQAKEAAQCAAYEERMANAESAYGCDPFARY